ncbi:SDR family oxidoreductase [Thalassotalea psychrophila]|uniref:SDR family oxidoreductase n=1 Tax=Thalassotalea psychrophila TaxID=3065647 RepID=A0ABY9TQV5_9GAMM|nr:SDR family oxidoreductase [Colwelliaceae bacterium SQ149]
MMNILITGANGFVGKHLTKYLITQNHTVTAGTRHACLELPQTEQFIYDNFNPSLKWQTALANIDVVIHCAARVHLLNDKSTDPLTVYREVNTKATVELAKQAMATGVKRFIFISSIKVNGESTLPDKPFTELDEPKPTDPYAISKLEAEMQLAELTANTSMDLVIIRPPLVYGPGVKANFAKMISYVQKGIPLPFGAIKNKRSLVAIDNLTHFIELCCKHPKAANQTFLISDDNDLSSTQLLTQISKALNKQSRLMAIPQKLLSFALIIIGLKQQALRLLENLQISPNKAKALLNWQPVISTEHALSKTVNCQTIKSRL